MDISEICRVCLEKGARLTPIFDPIKPPHFSILIMACAAVQVQEGDGLPPFICQRCISKLNVAFHFKTTCESSDRKLRQYLEQLQRQTAAYASEILTEQHSADQESEFTLASSMDIIPESQKNSDDLNPQLVTYKLELDGNFMEDSSSVKLDIDNSTESDNKKKPKRLAKIHQCNTCNKVFKAKPSLVHHVRIHTGERPYVCHLCQKRFINGGHLHTHMKTHTGEKNHVCAACSKGFATAQQLTKHTIAIHTSERPYGCTYCPKRFASSSNLNTHIKIHTGEKNFHCEICGKTFSTKGQLQQHNLVHTGEKSFLCEFCFKRFSQKAHLMRHLRIHSRGDTAVKKGEEDA